MGGNPPRLDVFVQVLVSSSKKKICTILIPCCCDSKNDTPGILFFIKAQLLHLRDPDIRDCDIVTIASHNRQSHKFFCPKIETCGTFGAILPLATLTLAIVTLSLSRVTIATFFANPIANSLRDPDFGDPDIVKVACHSRLGCQNVFK